MNTYTLFLVNTVFAAVFLGIATESYNWGMFGLATLLALEAALRLNLENK